MKWSDHTGDGRRLARAVRSQEGEELAVCDREGKPVDGRHFPIPLG